MVVSGFSEYDFSVFRDYLQSISGINLGEEKRYLVSSRIGHILVEEKCQSLAELTTLMQKPSSRILQQNIIDAMTTNETLWFRDGYPFENLSKRFFPELAKKTSRIRIWSAACSSGQEPYSIAMLAEEFRQLNLDDNPFLLDIVATDLSSKILDQAKNATYDNLSITRGLGTKRKDIFFETTEDGYWQLKTNIRKAVKFLSLNLLDPYTALGKFDMIFCRNVLIYFSQDDKYDIVKRMHEILKPGGYLVLGASEGVSSMQNKFKVVNTHPGAVFQAL